MGRNYRNKKFAPKRVPVKTEPVTYIIKTTEIQTITPYKYEITDDYVESLPTINIINISTTDNPTQCIIF